MKGPEQSASNSLRFWRIGFSCGSIFNRWHMILGWTPIISACVHANTSWFLYKKSASCLASSLPKPLWDPLKPLSIPQLTQQLILPLVSRDKCSFPLVPCLTFLPPGLWVAFLFSQLALVLVVALPGVPLFFLNLPNSSYHGELHY